MKSQVLEVEFNDGKLLAYGGVSSEVHLQFMAAPSAGVVLRGQDRGELFQQAAAVKRWPGAECARTYPTRCEITKVLRYADQLALMPALRTTSPQRAC